ncbi:MAG: SRPBCC family protein [Candidatus Dormibacteria bacterium]
MASKVSNTVEIARPLAEVFAFVDDHTNLTRYMVGMTRWEPIGSQLSGKGSKFAMTKKTNGLPDIHSEMEVVEWRRDAWLSVRSFAGFENAAEYRFEAVEGGTRVTLSNSYDIGSLLGGPRTGFFGGLTRTLGGAASKALEGQVMKDLERSLDNLKRLVEASPGVKPAMKATAKPAVKATAKPAVKAAAKPAVKATAKPAVKATAKPAVKSAARKDRPASKKG